MQESFGDPLTADDGRESAAGDAGTGAQSLLGKPKKRKRQMKRLSKVQLEDNYPSYIQVYFYSYQK